MDAQPDTWQLSVDPNNPEGKLLTADPGLPRKLGFLLEMHPYKVAYGGRNSLKSWNFARALLILATGQELRILCTREVQESIAASVHQLLVDQIVNLGLSDLYYITDDIITCKKTGSTFHFKGLSELTVASVKSFEGFDVAWVEEAARVTKRSWQILLPTIFRTPNAEVWVSFNPELDTDETWERFVVHPPEGAVVVEMNYRDAIACGCWNDEQEKLRQYDLIHSKNEYDNIWEGKPTSVVPGAIYTNEITDMIRDGRFRPMPYDPRLPVHRIWDLGWNDLMVVVMVQKPTPSSLVILNYFEDRFIKYSDVLLALDALRYRWGEDWLPHDGQQHDPKSGTSAFKLLKDLTGKMPKEIDKSNPEARIRAARMLFPRIYIDNTKRETPPDFPHRLLGASNLVERMKRYKRNVPKKTGEDTGPVHDINSHGADALGGLAEVVERIRNTLATDDVKPLAQFTNSEPSMGTLG